MSVEKVIKAIRWYSKFVIVSHTKPEGDALGSGLALSSLLTKLGKKVSIVNSEAAPDNYNYLPGSKRIKRKVSHSDYQVIFTLDCPDKRRIDSSLDWIDQKKPIINIDHHMDNQSFGSINWVDARASSTGEMIYRLFGLLHIKLNRQDALNIYTAILTDTGSFRHANTTSATHYICSQLLRYNIEPVKIYARIYETNQACDIVVAAKVISEMNFASNNRIAWVRIKTATFKKLADKHEILDRILDFGRSVSSVKVVIIFSQVKKTVIRISLRSKSPINVQRIAKIYGGGGHKFASGCIIRASLKDAERMILRQAKKTLLRKRKYQESC